MAPRNLRNKHQIPSASAIKPQHVAPTVGSLICWYLTKEESRWPSVTIASHTLLTGRPGRGGAELFPQFLPLNFRNHREIKYKCMHTSQQGRLIAYEKRNRSRQINNRVPLNHLFIA